MPLPVFDAPFEVFDSFLALFLVDGIIGPL